MSTRDDELEEQAESAGYGGATEGVGSETPPQEQQQPHLQEPQDGDEEDEASAADLARGDVAPRDEGD